MTGITGLAMGDQVGGAHKDIMGRAVLMAVEIGRALTGKMTLGTGVRPRQTYRVNS